jgi:hypothetical protein
MAQLLGMTLSSQQQGALDELRAVSDEIVRCLRKQSGARSTQALFAC